MSFKKRCLQIAVPTIALIAIAYIVFSLLWSGLRLQSLTATGLFTHSQPKEIFTYSQPKGIFTGTGTAARAESCEQLLGDLPPTIQLRQALTINEAPERIQKLAWLLDCNNEDAQVAVAAVQELGKTDSPAALPVLKKAWRTQQYAYNTLNLRRSRHGGGPSPDQNRFAAALQVAIARIGTRSLSGEARLRAVSKKIGLSFHDLWRLFNTVNDDYNLTMDEKYEAYLIVDDIVDLLESMAAQGQDISFVFNWKLVPAQKARLKAAALPTAERIEFLLDYLAHVDAFTEDNKQLASRHLFRIKGDVNSAIIKKLEDMAANPQNYNPHGNYYVIFRAAAMSGDARAKPLLRKFIKGVPGADDKRIKSHASKELSSMDENYLLELLSTSTK